MKTTVTMPALSPTMEEGALRKWMVKVGDRVRPGDILAEIETDKATMEVEAVEEGVVVRLLVPEGSEGVKVNSVIAELECEGSTGTAVSASPAPAALTPPAAPPPGRTDSAPAVVSRAAIAPRAEHGRRVRASPLARRLAAERGVDIAGVTGSGPQGRIVRADIEALASGSKAGTGPSRAASPADSPAGGFSLIEPATLDDRIYPPGSYELTPLDGVRRIAARRLTQSFMQVPHFPLTVDLEIDRLLSARRAMNETMSDGGKISVNDMLIKAAALSLIAEPDANASYTDRGIARHKSAHVSMAVAIEGGLITPVIRDAQTKGLAQIAAETRDLAARARSRKLTPQEYMGGTFSISNLGMFGIRSFSSILNPPEGMILSVGEGSLRPVVRNGELATATVMTVTLTCDHRVVDGAVGARWLQHFRQFVETPEAMLL